MQFLTNRMWLWSFFRTEYTREFFDQLSERLTFFLFRTVEGLKDEKIGMKNNRILTCGGPI